MKFNPLIPELSVRDINASKHFYINTIGFNLEYERIEDKFAFISLDEVQIMLEQVNGHWNTGELELPYGRGINLQMQVVDASLLRERIVSNGLSLFRDIYDVSYRENDVLHHEKEFLLQDPDGYLLRFSQSI